jgi:phosphoglycerate dehydrogenase-like enzyme
MRIWCNISYSGEPATILREGLAKHEPVFPQKLISLNLHPGESDPSLHACEVAFGQPDPEAIMRSSRLRWVHLNTAGYERYDRADLARALHARGAMLTTSSGVYDEPCAQHLLAMMLALSRQLPDALENQRSAQGWPAAEIRARSFLLTGQTVLLIGFGAIGQRLAELLAPFHMRLMAVRREVRGDELVPTYRNDRVDELLPQADHVINILPGGAGTAAFFDRRRLALLKPSAIFYNVGRGGTVDQTALVEMLTQHHLAAAYLDVMSPEPLPREHPLWRAPNCYLTPHTAGGHADEFIRIVRHFLANLGRFERGERLMNQVIGG